MAYYKQKKGVVTRHDYVVTNIRKSKTGRNYAVVYRPQAHDFVVANGYDTRDGTWAQGNYGFRTRKQAVAYAQKQASKHR